MDHYIDLILFEHTQVGIKCYRFFTALAPGLARCSKHDILKLGGYHRTSPAVGQGRSCALFEYILIILVDTHGGAVHALHNLTVDTAGDNSLTAPDILSLLGSQGDEIQLTLLLSEVAESFLTQLHSYLVDIAVLNLNVKISGHIQKLLLILDLIAWSLSSGSL